MLPLPISGPLLLVLMIPLLSVSVLAVWTRSQHRQAGPSSPSQAETARRIYNARAAKYDESFHSRFAAQYVQWASLRPGQHVLDVACGTGLVSLAAARAVGPAGSVTGVDVSDGMLAVARQKAAAVAVAAAAQRRTRAGARAGAQGAAVVIWIQHDVARLDELVASPSSPSSQQQQQQLRPGGYDAITAASCLPLFPDPGAVVKHWARFLAPGGRLAFDTPNERAFIPGRVFEQVALELGRPLGFGSGWIRGLGSVEALVHDARLELERSFATSADYGVARTYPAQQAPELFEQVASGAFGGALGEPAVRGRAKRLFVKKFRDLAGDGLVREREAFYVVVGRRRL